MKLLRNKKLKHNSKPGKGGKEAECEPECSTGNNQYNGIQIRVGAKCMEHKSDQLGPL